MSGGSLSGWVEGIILSLVFVAVLVIIISSMNLSYNKNIQLGLNDTSGSEQLFVQYQDTSQEKIQGGEVEFDANQGITLKSSYGLAKDAISIVWGFLSGGWIEQLVNTWNVGEAGTALGRGIRIIYFLSVVFALLYALFKVVI